MIFLSQKNEKDFDHNEKTSLSEDVDIQFFDFSVAKTKNVPENLHTEPVSHNQSANEPKPEAVTATDEESKKITYQEYTVETLQDVLPKAKQDFAIVNDMGDVQVSVANWSGRSTAPSKQSEQHQYTRTNNQLYSSGRNESYSKEPVSLSTDEVEIKFYNFRSASTVDSSVNNNSENPDNRKKKLN